MDRGFRYVLTLLLTTVALMQFIQVIWRYIVEQPLMGLEEMLVFPTLWLYMLGSVNASRSLLNFVNIFVGRIRGGMGVVATFSCALIGAISGSGLTGVAATGPLLIPEMVSKGYPRGYATALVANSSVLGLLIPPSVTMIIYGWVTDTSILACFLASAGPGLLITVLFAAVNMVVSRRFPLKVDDPQPVQQMLRTAGSSTLTALPALIMPVIILGGIYGGIMTPTEAAAVAVIYAFPAGFLVYKGLTWKKFFAAANSAATSIGTIMVMIIFSLMLSQIFVMEGIPQELVKGVFTITQDKTLLLILVNFLLFFIGMIVNDITCIILTAPLLLPLMEALGISPIQFAAIMGVNTAMGGVTPPYASILYLGIRVGEAAFVDVIKPGLILILFGYLPVVFLTSFWPDLALFLPRLLGY